MIVITGAAGRLGRRLVSALIKKGKKVRAIVQDVEAAKEIFSQKELRKIEFFEADLLTSSDEKLDEAVAGSECVIHLAGLVDFTAPAIKVIQVNYGGSLRMIQACERKKVKKFILTSSTSIYHDMSNLPITEESEPHPVNAYGRSKLFAENALKKSKIEWWVIIRPTAIYGPGFTEGFMQVAKNLLSGKMRVIGKGENRIALVHVDDVVQAFVLAVTATGKKEKELSKQAFIIAQEETLTQSQCLEIASKELRVLMPTRHLSVSAAKIIALTEELKGKILGRKPKLIREFVSMLSEDRAFSVKKAKKMLGWRQKVAFSNGLREFAAEMRKDLRESKA